MDITDTLAPTSEQLDAVDLLGGPRVFTVERVSKGNAEQPVNVYLAEFPRPWRPGKSMRRVLAACWGVDSTAWAGRRVELYCDTDVQFGGKAVGGTRISRLSHIDGPKKIPLLVTRGKSAVFTVRPLPDDEPASPPQAPIVTDETLRALVQTFELKGIPEAARLSGVNQITGGDATDLETITEAQALQVLESLKERPDA